MSREEEIAEMKRARAVARAIEEAEIQKKDKEFAAAIKAVEEAARRTQVRVGKDVDPALKEKTHAILFEDIKKRWHWTEIRTVLRSRGIAYGDSDRTVLDTLSKLRKECLAFETGKGYTKADPNAPPSKDHRVVEVEERVVEKETVRPKKTVRAHKNGKWIRLMHRDRPQWITEHQIGSIIHIKQFLATIHETTNLSPPVGLHAVRAWLDRQRNRRFLRQLATGEYEVLKNPIALSKKGSAKVTPIQPHLDDAKRIIEAASMTYYLENSIDWESEELNPRSLVFQDDFQTKFKYEGKRYPSIKDMTIHTFFGDKGLPAHLVGRLVPFKMKRELAIAAFGRSRWHPELDPGNYLFGLIRADHFDALLGIEPWNLEADARSMVKAQNAIAKASIIIRPTRKKTELP